MDLGISNRVALVSGADSGIGWHTTALLLEEGVQVVMTDMNPDSLRESAAKLEGKSGKVLAFPADLTKDEDVNKLREFVDAQVGDLDILVQCAGITGAQGLFHEIDLQGWIDTVNVDLIAPVRLLQAFLPGLRKGGWGRIVLTASEDAVQPYDDELPYCAAKAGILALAKGLSRSYASEGLLVNAVSPAFIETPMTDSMMKKRAEEKGMSFEEAIETFLEEERPYMELGRRGKPEEVASVIAFLCSDRASFVNGSNYRVDAGSVATI